MTDLMAELHRVLGNSNHDPTPVSVRGDILDSLRKCACLLRQVTSCKNEDEGIAALNEGKRELRRLDLIEKLGPRDYN